MRDQRLRFSGKQTPSPQETRVPQCVRNAHCRMSFHSAQSFGMKRRAVALSQMLKRVDVKRLDLFFFLDVLAHCCLTLVSMTGFYCCEKVAEHWNTDVNFRKYNA